MINAQHAGKEQDASCCGGPAPTDVDACCRKDAEAKNRGEDGCGCDTEPVSESPLTDTSSCC